MKYQGRCRSNRRHLARLSLLGATMLAAGANSAMASVQMFIQDFSGWQQAASSYSTVDFRGFAPNTFITEQYAPLRVHFMNPGPNVVQPLALDLFPQDGFGIDANGGILLAFDQPIHGIGGHGPGAWRFRLYSGGTQFYISPWWVGAPNGYSGLVSDTAFDAASFEAFGGEDVYSDNIYFSTIPAPSVIAMLAASGLVSRRRRG
ncbi:MAG: hypothetical protein SGJ09_08585 [Phycisphaerae bacterium]|nr:hypothetical protein [Phycisphaerae bacterium]